MIRIVVILAVVGIFWPAAVGAQVKVQGDALVVSPTRMKLSGSRPSGRFLLINKGDTTETYTVKMVALLDHENRAVDMSAATLFSPRQVTLHPGATQTVRLMVLRHKLPPAIGNEYRARIEFRVAPRMANAWSDGPDKGVDVGLTFLFGLTVPVILDGQ